MKEIKCPKCGEAFTIDETGYADIVKQIRDEEFNKDLKARLAAAETEKKSAIEVAEAKLNTEIEKLRALLKGAETAEKLAVTEAVAATEKKLAEEIKNRDAEIASLRDYKAKKNIKIIGESLEKHCETEFNRVRAMGFKNATFEKDNTVKEGGKGDYIFRDYSDEKVEFISIMFDMKDESEATVNKKKNEDFLEKLDKDRRAKNCEYAVLVSTLEAENDLYDGIVDVSHRYPKMFVVRPNFFLSIITLLRNAAQGVIEHKTELVRMKDQNLDISKFEEKLEIFKNSFNRDRRLAGDKFDDAIREIDKAIKALEKTKESLEGLEKNLDSATNKLDELTIKKLTRGNPTMADKFAALENEESGK